MTSDNSTRDLFDEVEQQPRQRATSRVSLSLDTTGGASSADAKGANINTIVAQYKKHGTLPAVHRSNPLYGDFTFPEDIHEMREAVYAAEDRFSNLPASVRTLCENDWVIFLDLFADPVQRSRLVEAGLQILDPTTQTTPTLPEPPPEEPSNPPAEPVTSPPTDPAPS